LEENTMTSPYLDQPPRTLAEALRQRHYARGLAHLAHHRRRFGIDPAHEAIYFLCGGHGIVWGTPRDDFERRNAEELPEALGAVLEPWP
jgi:hypothetical protein